jgi:microcin C transport system permease protein
VLLMVLFAGGSYWQIFPLRGLTSDNFDSCPFGKIKDYLWHITLPVTGLDDFGLCHADAADQEQLSGRDQQAICDDRPRQGPDRAAGAVWPCLPQRHADRDRGLSGDVSGRMFFGSSILIETIFSLDGLGRLGFEAGAARLSGDLRHALRLWPAGLLVGILSDLMYVLVDPRIDFERGRLMATCPN